MQPIKVMIVDDSWIVRRMVTKALEISGHCEVIYAAAHGRDAVDNFRRYQPDLLVVDIEMPQLDGIETVKVIRSVDARVPIIMFSVLTTAGAKATLAAMAAGADDYLEKPRNLNSKEEVLASLNDTLVPRVIALAAGKKLAALSATSAETPIDLRQFFPEVIGIGASTGGPQALTQLLSQLDETFSIPIVIVQHLPAVFTTLLAEQLDAVCPLKVQEAQEGERIRPGCVWIAQGSRHLRVESDGLYLRLAISEEPQMAISRPSVDVLFESLAEHYSQRCLSLMLTGMGRDGLAGSRSIVMNGGKVFAQDEDSSAVWGMPRAVAEAGLSPGTHTIDQMSALLNQLSAASTSRAKRKASVQK